MATNKNTRMVVADEQPDYDDDFTYGDDAASDPDHAEAAANCPVCGELLAWHEQACEAAPVPLATEVEAEAALEAEAPPLRLPTGYAYAIGGRVQPPLGEQTHAITWRGQLKERRPDTGLVHRVNVYLLDNGYWDCYHEEELQAA